MHRDLKLIRAVRTVAGIVLGILLISFQLSGQNGQVPHSSGDKTQSVSKAGNKTPQKGDDIPCVPTRFNTDPVKYTTPLPPGQKHKVDLRWMASRSLEVKEYEVHRCTPGGPCSVIASVNGTSYPDDTVEPRQDYCYFVTAFVKGRRDSDRESLPSNIIYVLIPSP